MSWLRRRLAGLFGGAPKVEEPEPESVPASEPTLDLADHIQRMMEDEARSPEPPPEFELAEDGVWECGPLSIRHKGLTRGVQPAKASIECRLVEHYDLDAMNDTQWVELRLHHWFRFRCYNIYFASIESKASATLRFQIEKEPSQVIPIQLGQENTLALHEIGRSTEGLHLWVRSIGDFEMVLRTEVLGSDSYPDQQWFPLGAGGFARRKGYAFYEAKAIDKSLCFRPEHEDTSNSRAATFGEDIAFSADEWLSFPDGLLLGIQRVHRFSKADWRPALILKKGRLERGGEIVVGREESFDVVGTYSVRLLDLKASQSEMPRVTLQVRLNKEAEFCLGESFVMQKGDIRESSEGIRIRYLGDGHAHGSKGVTEEGHEIHYTWGWSDFEIAHGTESKHMTLRSPDADEGESFPVSKKWKRFCLTLEGYDGGGCRVRVDTP